MGILLNNAVVKWVLAALWTVILCFLMLSPGSGTVADDVSRAFGGTEFSDALGHTALAFVQTFLLARALATPARTRRALWIASALTLLLLFSLEIAQVWIPDRGASLLDASANAIGVGLCAAAVIVSVAVANRTEDRTH
mgnify:CR=1 FL=1